MIYHLFLQLSIKWPKSNEPRFKRIKTVLYAQEWTVSPLKRTSCFTEGSLSYAIEIYQISKNGYILKSEKTTDSNNDCQYYCTNSIPQICYWVLLVCNIPPLNRNYIFSNSTKSNGFPPFTFKSNVSGRRHLEPTIGHKRYWTIREFIRRLTAPVVLVLSVGWCWWYRYDDTGWYRSYWCSPLFNIHARLSIGFVKHSWHS